MKIVSRQQLEFIFIRDEMLVVLYCSFFLKETLHRFDKSNQEWTRKYHPSCYSLTKEEHRRKISVVLMWSIFESNLRVQMAAAGGVD